MKILTRRKFHDVRHFVCSKLHACAQTPLAAFCRAAPPWVHNLELCQQVYNERKRL